MTPSLPNGTAEDHPNRLILPCLACGLLLSLVLGWRTEGVCQDDDLTHFLMARWAAWYPGYLLHIWGRPGATVPTAAIAWLPNEAVAWHLARVLSALMTAAGAWMAARLAAALGLRRPWLVVLATYAQPLSAVLSYTTLTENFAAFYLITAVFLLQRRRLSAASAVLSLALVTRYETVVFIPVWLIALAGHRTPRKARLRAGLLCFWAPLAHNLLHRWWFGAWPASIYLRPTGSTEYLPAGWLAYIPDALHAITPALSCLAVLGALAMIRRRKLLIPALAVLFFATHLAIKAVGLYASGGYGRFMVTIAPLIAILAAAGLNECIDHRRRDAAATRNWRVVALVWLIALVACEVERRSGRLPGFSPIWMGVAAGVACVIILLAACFGLRRSRSARQPWQTGLAAMIVLTWAAQWGLTVRPLEQSQDIRLIREVVTWMEERGLSKSPFFSTNPWFAQSLGLVENPRAHKDPELLASMPVGTVFIWDSRYSTSDYHQLDPAQSYAADPHYRLLKRFARKEAGALSLWVFQKVLETPAPKVDRAFFPRPLTIGREPVRGVYYLREKAP